MARPPRPRRVASPPRCSYFKPAGVPLYELEEVALSLDEFEALRLADLEGLYQDDGAERMGVSRGTFARIVEASRRKVALALVRGLALRIAGGPVAFTEGRRLRCKGCRHEWCEPHGAGRSAGCPACRSGEYRRVDRESSTPRSAARRPRGAAKAR